LGEELKRQLRTLDWPSTYPKASTKSIFADFCNKLLLQIAEISVVSVQDLGPSG
jgi:hypothetical protein